MKRLTRVQIEVLRELVQEQIAGIKSGEYIPLDRAGDLEELGKLSSELEAMYHATPDIETEAL